LFIEQVYRGAVGHFRSSSGENWVAKILKEKISPLGLVLLGLLLFWQAELT
jgi:hypothetical protein